MSDVDHRHFHRTGGILIAAGAVLGALSFFLPDVLLAGGLLIAAVIARFEQRSENEAVDLGLALGLFGGLLFLHAVASIGPFGSRSIAGFLVLGGIFEIAIAPRFVKYAKGKGVHRQR